MMRELPVIACVRHILNSVYAFRRQAARIALPWIAVITTVNVVEILLGPGLDAAPGNGSSPMQLTAAEIVTALLGLFAASAISVNWHRYILRDEVPQAAQLLRFDGLAWRYFGTFLLILFTAFAVTLAASLPFAFLALNAAFVPLLAIAVAAIAYGRLGLALPAAALGRSDFGLAAAFKATEGNTWRILGVLAINFAIVLGVLVVMLSVLLVARAAGPAMFLTIAVLAGVPANIFVSILTASQLNSLYGFFVEGRNF